MRTEAIASSQVTPAAHTEPLRHAAASSKYKIIDIIASLQEFYSHLGSISHQRSATEGKNYLQHNDDAAFYTNLEAAATLVGALAGGLSGGASAFFPKGEIRSALKTAGTALPQLGQGLSTLGRSQATKNQSLGTYHQSVILAGTQEGARAAEHAGQNISQFATSFIERSNRKQG